MTPINDFKIAFWSNRHCDRCIDISCGFNKLFMEFQAITAGRAVPAGFCQNINCLIDDNNIDIVLRSRVYQALLDDSIPLMPLDSSEAAKSEWMDKAVPACMNSRVIDRTEWPAFMRDKLAN